MKQFRILFVFLVCLNYNSISFANNLSTVLFEVQERLNDNNRSGALELLKSSIQQAINLENESLNLQEEFLWQAAITPLDFSNQLNNKAQYESYAETAYERWKNYILWYLKLSDEQKQQLPTSRIRIKKAVAHLGNSIIRMGKPHLLFEEYSNMYNVNYLGIDAIKLWKHWLYSCPTMTPIMSSERTAKKRKNIICNPKCTNFWGSYGTTLKEWANVEYLRTSVKNKKIKESNQVNKIYEECGGDEL